MGPERGRIAVRLACVAAGRWGENSPLQKRKLNEPQSGQNAFMVSRGASQKKKKRKTFKARTRRAARYMAIAGAEAEMVRRVIAKMVGGERLAALGARAVGKIFRPYGMTGHSIKRGALADAAAAAVEHDLDPRILKQLGNARGTGTGAKRRAVPGTLGRHFEQLREVCGPHVEGARGMAKLPCAPAKAGSKVRRQGRFLMGADF
uniref:Uncharacterized protein n=1 Tax=Trypanosoma vivax (strain Y486) TaxID=1055687 RepID=G0UA69_TRYVY|nr:hypothetical protein, conserved in T. vivax [Trypanosoma vivax Y486]